MTGRVCPVHGEYSASGICRWCDPADLVQMEYIRPTAHRSSRYWPVKSVTAKELVEEFGDDETPSVGELVADELDDYPDASLLREVMEILGPLPKLLPPPYTLILVAPISWRLEYDDPCRIAAVEAAEESRLLAQHAALRWERVARRWNYKHRREGGLDEEGRAVVWRYWVAFNRTTP